MVRNKRLVVFAVWVVCFGFGYSQISTTAVTATLKAYSDARTGKPVFEFILKNNLGTNIYIHTQFDTYDGGRGSANQTYLLMDKKDSQWGLDPIQVFNVRPVIYNLLPNSEYKYVLPDVDYNNLTPENLDKATFIMAYFYQGHDYHSQIFPVVIDKTPPATRVPVDRTQPTEPVDGSRR